MYGYYIFLGRGDWGTSRDKTFDPTFDGNVSTKVLGDWGPHRQGTELADAPQWSSGWDLRTWKRHVDFLIDPLGADTLFLVMNGYELPYPSESFPEAIELDHANVRDEFLPELLDYATGRGLTLYAQFCTTGHAVAYAHAHPDCTTILPDGKPHATNLCHHHPRGRAYAETIVTEVLNRYEGFSGVSFHPPENAVPCACKHCRAAFEQQAGKPITEATEGEISDFYWASCMAYQHHLEDIAMSILPDAPIGTATIPGQWEKDFAIIAQEVPKTTTIYHWDYWSFGERIPELIESLELFRSAGHRVVFIASAGWALDKCGPDYGAKVVAQIDAARTAGVTDNVYFVGGIWNEQALRATSWKLARGT